jgi:hypothetical protein
MSLTATFATKSGVLGPPHATRAVAVAIATIKRLIVASAVTGATTRPLVIKFLGLLEQKTELFLDLDKDALWARR